MLPIVIPTARSNGMGGSHTAYTDTVFALLVNPAAIMCVEQKSVFGFSPVLLNPKGAYDVGNSMVDIGKETFQGNLGALTGILDAFKGDGDNPTGFDLREFPLSFAWVANGLGVGIWSRFFTNPEIVGSQKQLNLYGDVIMPVGFAIRLLETNHQSIDVGITLKPFARVIVQGKLDPDILSAEGLDLFDPSLGSSSVPLIAGTGFDAGIMYRWSIGLNAGFTANDIITRGKTVYALREDKDDYIYYVPFTMNLGLAYDFKIGNFAANAPAFLANTGIAFAANWHDILNTFQQDDDRRNFLLDLSAGIELTLFDKLMLRAGMNELQPAYGIGVNLGPTQIDLAYYEKEFGKERGQFSVPMLELTVAVRPKAKERDWFWTRPIFGGKTKTDEE